MTAPKPIPMTSTPTQSQLQTRRLGPPEFNAVSAPAALRRFLETVENYPARYSGRGIVIPAGRLRYFPGAWVGIRLLRDLGCDLPIQICYLGECEFRWSSIN